MSFTQSSSGLGVTTGAMFASSAWWPPLDVYESEDRYVIVVEVGGVPEDALQVEVSGSQVRIAGSRQSPANRVGESLSSVHHREIDHGEFERHIILPGPIAGDAVEASVAQGFLEITLPKRPSEGGSTSRCIEVR
ncbi:MAG: Hsp20 family protein [Armatimonadia bacterium]|nr:Hsp20 family protein [Armatimonadia bacterium]